MKVQGTIKIIKKTQTFGSNGFRKRELVITTDEQYPQHFLVEFVQDKTDLLDKFKINQNVIIGINIRGREWVNPQGETKYFNSLQAWKINKVDSSTPETEQPFETVSQEDLKEAENDLPF